MSLAVPLLSDLTKATSDVLYGTLQGEGAFTSGAQIKTQSVTAGACARCAVCEHSGSGARPCAHTRTRSSWARACARIARPSCAARVRCCCCFCGCMNASATAPALRACHGHHGHEQAASS
jgi:hypothetical protein